MTASASAGRRNILTNAAVNWIGFAVQVAITFFLTPFLFNALGDKRYGFWSIVEQFLAYLMLFDCGVGASVVRYVARFEATQDRENLNGVFSTALAIFGMAGLAVLAITAAVAFGLIQWFRVPVALLPEVRGLLIVLGANLAIGLPLGVFPALLDGLGRFPAKIGLRTVMLVIRALVIVYAVGNGGGLIALGSIITGCTVAEYLGLAALSWFYLPALRFSFALVSRTTFRTIRGYSLDAFLIMLASRISFQTDSLVIFAFLGPGPVASFAIVAKLVEYAKDSLRVITTVFTPAISALEARGDHDGIRGMFVNSTRYILWLILPVQIGLFALGKPFLTVWIKDAALVERSFPVLVILALPLALAISQSVATRVLYGTSRLTGYSRACMAEAIANLVLSIALVLPLGLEGVAWGTTIPNIIVNLGLAVFMCRLLALRGRDFAMRSVLPPVVPAALLALFWWAASAWWPSSNWGGLIMVGAIGLVGYAALATLAEFGPLLLSRLTPRALAPAPRVHPALVGDRHTM